MRGIIDQIEGKWVIVEVDGVTTDFKKSIFPKNVKVGDVVEINGDNVRVLQGETDRRRQEIEDLMDELWEDD